MLINRTLVLRGLLLAAICLAVVRAVTPAHLGDVEVYRVGGQTVFGGDLYAARVGAFGFTYPPFAAELFALVAWLPATAMFGVLTLLSAVALLLVVRRVLPGVDRRASTALGAVVLMMAHPVIVNLAWGQINLVLAALVLHDLLVRRSGVLIGLAAALKLTPGVFVLYLLLCGRRREAGTAALTFAGVSAVGALLAPGASWRYWTHDAVAGSGIGGFDHTGNQSVRGLAERVVGDTGGVLVWLVVAVPLLVVGLVLARRAARAGNEVLAAGVAGVTACLVSPVSWIHHWVWCIPCLAALPRTPRAVLAVLFLLPWGFGHVVGSGYPVIAIVGFAIACRRSSTRDGRDEATVVRRRTVAAR